VAPADTIKAELPAIRIKKENNKLKLFLSFYHFLKDLYFPVPSMQGKE
jgi:hypothetical protein